jgi:threonine dehydrogenase-like Zn-dependent dehydrogenase
MTLIRIKKAVLHGAGDLRLEEELYDPEHLGAFEVFVETEVTGFSTGTDLGNYEGRSTELPGAPDYPRTVGYSNVGRVRFAGDRVASLRPGDRVFSMKPHCSAFVASESELLVPVPTNVDAEQASLSYLIHLGIAALRGVCYEAGETVAIIGMGVIGLCTVGAARAIGSRVIALANDERRAEIARRTGAHEVYLSGHSTLRPLIAAKARILRC